MTVAVDFQSTGFGRPELRRGATLESRTTQRHSFNRRSATRAGFIVEPWAESPRLPSKPRSAKTESIPTELD